MNLPMAYSSGTSQIYGDKPQFNIFERSVTNGGKRVALSSREPRQESGFDSRFATDGGFDFPASIQRAPFSYSTVDLSAAVTGAIVGAKVRHEHHWSHDMQGSSPSALFCPPCFRRASGVRLCTKLGTNKAEAALHLSM